MNAAGFKALPLGELKVIAVTQTEPVSLVAEPNNSVDSTKSVSDTIRV